MTGELWVHPFAAAAEPDAARRLRAWPVPEAAPERFVAAVSRDGQAPAAPADPAIADREVAAALAGRSPLREGAPVVVPRMADLLGHLAAKGASAGETVRHEPQLLPHHPAGGWLEADAASRGLRRIGLIAPRPATRLLAALPAGGARRLAADIAFWAGVREALSRDEWRWLTSSYTAFIAHRISPQRRPGEQRMNLSPQRFHGALRLLAWLGWRPLSAAELAELHGGRPGTRSRRRYVVTLDDGFADAVAAATSAGRHRPHLYVCTDGVGGAAGWWRSAPLAGWPALARAAAAGCVVGSHSASHDPLPDLRDDALAASLVGSRQALTEHGLPEVGPLLAYPHGRHDERVRCAARAAGFRLAWTTAPGRNGPGTEPMCLRRIALKDWDSAPAVVWKALTGEPLPGLWERRLVRRWETGAAGDPRRWQRGRRAGAGQAPVGAPHPRP